MQLGHGWIELKGVIDVERSRCRGFVPHQSLQRFAGHMFGIQGRECSALIVEAVTMAGVGALSMIGVTSIGAFNVDFRLILDESKFIIKLWPLFDPRKDTFIKRSQRAKMFNHHWMQCNFFSPCTFVVGMTCDGR